MCSLRSTIIIITTIIITAFAGLCPALSSGVAVTTTIIITITIITIITATTADRSHRGNRVLRDPVFCPLFLAAFFLCRTVKMPIGAVEHDIGR